MKLVSLNIFITILMILCEKKYTISSKQIEGLSILNKKLNSEGILKDLKDLKLNLTNLYDNLSVIHNVTNHIKTNKEIKYNSTVNFNLNISDPDLKLSKPKAINHLKNQKIELEERNLTDSMNTYESLNNSLTNLRKFHDSLDEKIKSFENQNSIDHPSITSHSKIKRKKTNKQSENDENSFMFYNSLSLIMLSMLAGGLVGVVFILYFSFKKDNDLEIR